MRVDVNVSVRRADQPYGTRCEIKNVNSVRSVGKAIEYEARRQVDLLESGSVVRQETRHWDDAEGRTHTLRTKEDADDYRYFLEPDLVVLDPDQEWIESIRRSLPMLPAARRDRLARAAEVDNESEAIYVVVERGQDDYVLAVALAGGDANRALVYVQQGFADAGQSPKVPPRDLAALTVLERDAKVTSTQAKTILAEIVAADGGDPVAIAEAKGFRALDLTALAELVDGVIASQGDAWAKYCAGEEKALGALVGAAMKSSQGKADGKAVTALLQTRRDSARQ